MAESEGHHSIFTGQRGLMRAAGCWASQGYSAEGCAALEQSLRACMDAKVRRNAVRVAGPFGAALLRSRDAETGDEQEEQCQLSSLALLSTNDRSSQTEEVMKVQWLLGCRHKYNLLNVVLIHGASSGIYRRLGELFMIPWSAGMD
nr:hypothetical protein CFP56_37252 [Quercus suber]